MSASQNTNSKLVDLLRLTPASAGVLATLALLVTVLIVALFRALAGLGQEVALAAPPVWDALVSGLTWLVLGTGGVLGVAAAMGVVALVRSGMDRERRRREVAVTSQIPHDSTMNGAVPRSEADRISAEGLHQLAQRNSGSMTTKEIALLRARLPELYRDPGFDAEWSSKVAGPLFVRAQAGDETVLGWLRGYAQQREKRPFRVLLRLLHGLTLGRWGCSAQDIWIRPQPELEVLLTDVVAFGQFTREYLYPYMATVEALLEPGNVGPESLPPPTEPEPEDSGKLEPSPEPCEDPPMEDETPPRSCLGHEAPEEEAGPEKASPESQMEEVRRVLAEEQPWSDPGQLLSVLHDAVSETLADHPRPQEVEALLTELERMQSELPEFPPWFDRHTKDPPENPGDPWPQVLEKALWASRDELHPDLFKANAVRLYLTGPREDRELNPTSASCAPTPRACGKSQNPGSGTAKPAEAPTLTVIRPDDPIPEVKPSEAEFLF